jgi:hypothetical protein
METTMPHSRTMPREQLEELINYLAMTYPKASSRSRS